jgi:hypothetical protein
MSMLEHRDRDDGGDWKVSWEAHRRTQLTLGRNATPAQRLAWLEEMIDLAFRTGALPRRTEVDRS